MASSNVLQERQLLLLESVNKRMDLLLDGQRKLEEANASLQKENEKLKSQLQGTPKSSRRASRHSRRDSSVEIPNDLRKRFRFIYKKLVEKNMSKGFIIDEDPQSEGNQQLFSKVKDILKKEHGGENCPWTDLQMEAQFYRYFKTQKERANRIKRGTNEEHQERCKKNRRLLTKLERRHSAFEMCQSSMSPKERQFTKDVLYLDYMSSEESDYEEEEDYITGEKERKLSRYLTKQLPWERTALRNVKSKLDRAYRSSLTSHARAMAKPRQVGEVSTRPRPDGPSWAVRQVSTD